MLDMSKFWESPKQAAQEMGGKVLEVSMQVADGRKRWPGTINTATIKTPDGITHLYRIDCYGWCKSIMA